MKKTLTLLAASTALTAAIGFPAWSAMQASSAEGLSPVAALFEGHADALPLVLASDDDDDRRGRKSKRRGYDDDDDDEDDDDDDDERGNARNPAPAGSVAPPQNGLFGGGAAPKAKVN